MLLDPDILSEVRQLPWGMTGTAVVLGALLWLFGARSHRFWLALVVTVAAGLLGLSYGRESGLGPLVAGLLVAVAAGALALALVRILLFVAGGFAALLFMQAVAPEWNDRLVSFLVGGLIGVLLYRVWVAALSSFLGTMVGSYALLGLLDRLGRLDSAGWAERNGPLLNWGVLGIAAIGLLVQVLLERRRSKSDRGEKKKKKGKGDRDRRPPPPDDGPPPSDEVKVPWWKVRVSLPWSKAS